MFEDWNLTAIGNLNNKTLDELLGLCSAEYCVAIEFRNFHHSIELGLFGAKPIIGDYKNLGNPTIISSKCKDAVVFQSNEDGRGCSGLVLFTVFLNTRLGNKMTRFSDNTKLFLAWNVPEGRRSNTFSIALHPDLIPDLASYHGLLLPGVKSSWCERGEAGDIPLELSTIILEDDLKILATMTPEKRSKIIVELSPF